MRNLFRTLLPAAVLALCGMLPLNVVALPFNSLVIFGDSPSDAGNNAFHFDNVIGPPAPPGTLRTATPTPAGFVPIFPLRIRPLFERAGMGGAARR